MKKLLIRLFAFLLCVFCLAGCGDSAKGTAAYAIEDTEITSSEDNGISYDADYSKEAESGTENSIYNSSEKLVYTGSVNVESKTYDETYSWIREQISSLGGMIESEYVYRSSYDSNGNLSDEGCRSLSMTIRIPSEQFYSFLDNLEGSCHVLSRSTSIENITQAYNDVSVQIEALEKQEASLLTMMDQAQTIEDMITVQDHLTEVQTQLNQLKTQRSAMDTDVAYSTINLSMDEVGVYTTSTEESFGTKAANAIASGFHALQTTVSAVALFLLFLLPFLLVAGVIAAVIVWIVLTAVKHGRKKRAEKEKDHTEV